MPSIHDGPASTLFKPVLFKGNAKINSLPAKIVSPLMIERSKFAPAGDCTLWGIPFRADNTLLISNQQVSVPLKGLKAKYLVFMHASDHAAEDQSKPWPYERRKGRLGEHCCDYVIVYADGSQQRLPIMQRFQIGSFTKPWGPVPYEAVGFHKPHTAQHGSETVKGDDMWKLWLRRARANVRDMLPWMYWLWAWENPQPGKAIKSLRIEPGEAVVVLSAISAGSVSSNPLRWNTRRKAILHLPSGEAFDPALDDHGLLKCIQLDMGQVISATPQKLYPDDDQWKNTYNNCLPKESVDRMLIEYAAHDDAKFHLAGGRTIAAGNLEERGKSGGLQTVAPASQRVTIRVIDKASRMPVPVKLHIHGQAGEYLPPIDRHRHGPLTVFDDYAADFTAGSVHQCSYIDGQTDVLLPLGEVYIEVSKGFEIAPIHVVRKVTRATRTITLVIQKVLPWREKGWVTADTHVHFLSPSTALLEGQAEGVNVVNLLASQWGEMMTNVGDFDGRTTLGSRQFGGNGEYLVRVGTENRQHVLGHISLLGYSGRMITPLTTGGPDESAIGDGVQMLLTQWARQCRKQGGLVVAPHFPVPTGEHAVTLVNGDLDGVEMASWSDLSGIDPYSLADWYRYLNCGYITPAVAGTDKMYSFIAVGAVRTYAKLGSGGQFTYNNWMDAIRSGNTFVTVGPLMEFSVEGRPIGSRLAMPAGGGTVDVSYKLASVNLPMTRVELVRNGEVIDGTTVAKFKAEGYFKVKIDSSSWLALLVRGQYPNQAEVIAAHSSSIVLDVKNSPMLAAADAMTILQQIEGVIAHFDSLKCGMDSRKYKEMRLLLTSAHRRLHNRLHRSGHFHHHTPANWHDEHG